MKKDFINNIMQGNQNKPPSSRNKTHDVPISEFKLFVWFTLRIQKTDYRKLQEYFHVFGYIQEMQGGVKTRKTLLIAFRV